MSFQISREPLLETAGTLLQHGTEPPHCTTHTKWKHLTRLWTDTTTELRLDMESIPWVHTTAITLYLCLCCIWAASLVFACVFILLPSLYYDDSGNQCGPDGLFRFDPPNLLAPAWFFQVVLGFGSLSFTWAKTIDIAWDIVVGRAGQTLLAYISWRTFSKSLHSAMMTDPVTYQTFWAVFMQNGPSLWSIIFTIRDFTWLRGLRSKATMVFMILTMIFALAFPTLASAMTGYSANNQVVIRTYDDNQVLFSKFQRVQVRYVIHDGDRVNKSIEYAVTPSFDDYKLCGAYNCIDKYISDYGVSQHTNSTWNMTNLESPTLNITSYLDGKSAFVFDGKFYDDEYFTTNNNAICQPAMEGNQQKYQWGSSLLQLEITLCLLTLWTFGIYIAWAAAHLRLTSMGIAYNSPGNIQSTITLADAIQKDFEELHGNDANILTKREVMSYIKTHVSGGRVMVQSPPLVPRQSLWKWIWTWVMANKGWTVAFSIVSLSMVFYAMTSLILITMIFSLVAGWSPKTRYIVLFLSLVSGGLIPAEYLMVRLLREFSNGFFGGPITKTSEAGR